MEDQQYLSQIRHFACENEAQHDKSYDCHPNSPYNMERQKPRKLREKLRSGRKAVTKKVVSIINIGRKAAARVLYKKSHIVRKEVTLTDNLGSPVWSPSWSLFVNDYDSIRYRLVMLRVNFGEISNLSSERLVDTADDVIHAPAFDDGYDYASDEPYILPYHLQIIDLGFPAPLHPPPHPVTFPYPISPLVERSINNSVEPSFSSLLSPRFRIHGNAYPANFASISPSRPTCFSALGIVFPASGSSLSLSTDDWYSAQEALSGYCSESDDTMHERAYIVPPGFLPSPMSLMSPKRNSLQSGASSKYASATSISVHPELSDGSIGSDSIPLLHAFRNLGGPRTPRTPRRPRPVGWRVDPQIMINLPGTQSTESLVKEDSDSEDPFYPIHPLTWRDTPSARSLPTEEQYSITGEDFDKITALPPIPDGHVFQFTLPEDPRQLNLTSQSAESTVEPNNSSTEYFPAESGVKSESGTPPYVSCQRFFVEAAEALVVRKQEEVEREVGEIGELPAWENLPEKNRQVLDAFISTPRLNTSSHSLITTPSSFHTPRCFPINPFTIPGSPYSKRFDRDMGFDRDSRIQYTPPRASRPPTNKTDNPVPRIPPPRLLSYSPIESSSNNNKMSDYVESTKLSLDEIVLENEDEKLHCYYTLCVPTVPNSDDDNGKATKLFCKKHFHPELLEAHEIAFITLFVDKHMAEGTTYTVKFAVCKTFDMNIIINPVAAERLALLKAVGAGRAEPNPVDLRDAAIDELLRQYREEKALKATSPSQVEKHKESKPFWSSAGMSQSPLSMNPVTDDDKIWLAELAAEREAKAEKPKVENAKVDKESEISLCKDISIKRRMIKSVAVSSGLSSILRNSIVGKPDTQAPKKQHGAIMYKSPDAEKLIMGTDSPELPDPGPNSYCPRIVTDRTLIGVEREREVKIARTETEIPRSESEKEIRSSKSFGQLAKFRTQMTNAPPVPSIPARFLGSPHGTITSIQSTPAFVRYGQDDLNLGEIYDGHTKMGGVTIESEVVRRRSRFANMGKSIQKMFGRHNSEG